MSLPAQIGTSADTFTSVKTDAIRVGSFIGPLKVGSALYVCCYHLAAGTESWRMFKSTDGGSTWTAQDTAHEYAIAYSAGTTYFGGHSIATDGTTILLAGNEQYASNKYLIWQIYTVSSDTWGTATSMANSGGAGARDYATGGPPAVAMFSTGDAVIAYNTASNGIEYHRRTSGTWGAAVAVNSTGTVLDSLSAVLGASNRVHFFWNDTGNGKVLHRSVSSAGTLDTEATIDSSVHSTTTLRAGVAGGWTVSGTAKIAVPYRDSSGKVSVARADSGANPTFTVSADASDVAVLASDRAMALAGNTSGQIALLYSRSSDSDVARDLDLGGGFATDVTIYASVTVGRVSAQLNSSTISYVVDDNGTLRYNESTFVAASGTATDSVTYSDSPAVAHGFARAPSDSVTFSDSPAITAHGGASTLHYTATAADSITYMDAPGALLGPSLVTLDRMKIGETSHGTVDIYGVPTSSAWRLFDSGNSTIGSATESGGVATITPSQDTTTGYIVGYTDNTYATPIAYQRYPATGNATIKKGNVLDKDPARLGLYGLDVIDDSASYYYANSQYGSSGAICATSQYIFIAYRTGGAGSAFSEADGQVVVVRYVRSSKKVDQSFTLTTVTYDGHEFFGVQRAPSGKLRAVYGGIGQDIYIRESTSADSVAAWGSETSIHAPNNFQSGNFKVASDGTCYAVFSTNHSGTSAGLIIGTAANGNITSWTWNVLTTDTTYAPLLGDLTIDESTSPFTAAIVFGSYKWLSPAGNWSDYGELYYLKTQDAGATAKKADGSTITLPLTFSTGGSCGADLVSSGHHYGYAAKLVHEGGVPTVIADGDRGTGSTHIGTNPYQAKRWNGSSWASNDMPEIQNGNNFGITCLTQSGRLVVVTSFGRVSPSPQPGYEIMRYISNDHFATSSAEKVMDGQYPPYAAAAISSTPGSPHAGIFSFEYPQSPVDAPNFIFWSAVDAWTATVLITEASFAWTSSASDTVTYSDAPPTSSTGHVRPVDETLGLTDSMTFVHGTPIELTIEDALGIADIVSHTDQTIELLGLTDDQTAALAKTQVDDEALTDLADRLAAADRTYLNPEVLTDLIVQAFGTNTTREEAENLTDLLAQATAAAQDIPDTVGLTDDQIIALIAGQAAATVDPVGLTDDVILDGTAVHAFPDPLALRDKIIQTVNRPRENTDDLAMTDSIHVTAGAIQHFGPVRTGRATSTRTGRAEGRT